MSRCWRTDTGTKAKKRSGKQGDLSNDGVCDIWRLEGPSLVWHFRGASHVHTWVNIAKDAKLSDAHT